MYAVGRIGSYISRGVYTVSGPFHPFGGAVDIIVVEQPDGSFKSSPWYVRFGKFQGVLKTKEKVVNISVNGIEANFNMYLDNKGEAYFLKEVDAEEGESVSYISTSGDETDGQSTSNRKPTKSRSCNYDADKLNPAAQNGASNRKIVSRSGSRRARILGLVFGRRSIKEDSCQEGEGDVGMVRLSSLERAEIAADLLEVKWSTNMPSSKSRKDNVSHFILDDTMAKDMRVNDGETDVNSSEHDNVQNRNGHSLFHKETSSLNGQMTSSSNFSPENLGSSVEDAGVGVCIGTVEQVVEASPLGESILKDHSEMLSEISRRIDEFGVGNADHDEHAIFHEETGSLNEQMANRYNLNSESLGSSVENAGLRISCIGTMEQVIESPSLGQSILKEHSEMVSEISRKIDKLGVGNADHDEHAIFDKETGSLNEQMPYSFNFSSENLQSSVEDPGEIITCIGIMEQVVESILKEDSEIAPETSRRINESDMGNDDKLFNKKQACADSKIQCKFEADHDKQFDEELACDKIVEAFPGSRTSTEIKSDRVQSSVYCETSESSVVWLDGSNEQTQETLHVASGRSGKVHVHLETLHVTTEILKKGTDSEQARDIELEKESVDISGDRSDKMNLAASEPNYNDMDFEEPSKAEESYNQVVSIEPGLCSVKEIYSQNRCTSLNAVQDGKDISDELHQHLKSSGNSQEPYSDGILNNPVRNSPSENSEEEQFLFSDLEEAKLSEVQHTNSSSSDCARKGDHPTFCDEGIMEVNGSVSTNDESCSSPDMLGQDNWLNDLENSTEKLRVRSSPLNIHGSHKAAEEVGRLAESLPIMRSPTFKSCALDCHPLSHSLDSNSDSLKWKLFKENDSSYMKLDADKEQHVAEERPNVKDSQISQEPESVPSSPPVGGSWRLWPFTFRRKGMQPTQSDTKSSDAEVVLERINEGDVAKSAFEPKVAKKMVRLITPTSEQLASLNLKEGSNTVTFTFSTAMLGKQQVDARIYMWKWNARIVISDVDGTITKSDVLGQFMPLVGMDWSQMGVANLFSAIKENGYQLLFLSARAISQAYHTRQFLFNLKQDGKALPEGPVVISPDGLFPSLFREVIRRAPHEFKISCLEDIKALFPSDCNPFYAGFGNRDTDEISYLKVGIPRGKIFIINPKGEVVVNRRVDTKSYGSLHALVHDMFPHTTSSEQEDFNSWNYWKLPPPDINVEGFR